MIRILLSLLVVVLAVTFAFWALWVIGNLAHTRGRRLIYGLALFLAGLIGIVVDVFYQFTFAWLLFLQAPREPTVSQRLTRYLRTLGPTGPGPRHHLDLWRLRAAAWVATYLVEPWSPGHVGLVRYGFPAARNVLGEFTARYPSPLAQFAAMAALAALAVGAGWLAWGFIA